MHNAPKPKLEDLPTKAQLHRSTSIAGIAAVAIGVMVFLPAEFGQDPTGIGTPLGLTEMGLIKQELKAEAAADAVFHSEQQALVEQDWQDTITFTLAPKEFTEFKARMEKGATLFYEWSTEGGRINFDLHAHADGKDVSYKKGRGQREDQGSFETPFAGDHGWFWRNRDDEAVTVTLQIRGDYSAIVRDE